MSAPSIRVLIVGPVMPEDGGTTSGGVAAHVSVLARALAHAGTAVAVFAGNTRACPGRRDAPWGPMYAPTPLRGACALRAFSRAALRTLSAANLLMAAGQRPALALSQVLGIAEAVRDFRPDVIHFHHAELRPLYARLAGVDDLPSVITLHSLSAFRAESSTLKELASEHLRSSDVVVCVSRDVCERVRDLVPGVRGRVIPNPIDLDAFRSPPHGGSQATPAALRRSEPGAPTASSSAAPLVLYLGWLARSKGVEDLASAMREVRAHSPSARLALVGPTIDVSAEEIVRGAGLDTSAYVTSEATGSAEVAAWLHSASVLVLPSRIREGQSRVVVEALAAGLPVVATRSGGPEELLDDGTYGTLVDTEDVPAIARAIIDVLEHPAEARARSSAAMDAIGRFDSAVVAEEVASAYGEAVALNASGRQAGRSESQ